MKKNSNYKLKKDLRPLGSTDQIHRSGNSIQTKMKKIMKFNLKKKTLLAYKIRYLGH
jgi:hypothetical protein